MKKQLIIIGGGTSIKEGISKDLWSQVQNKFSFGLNYSYIFFNSTVQLWVDKRFYSENHKNLDNLPLILCNYHARMECHKCEGHKNKDYCDNCNDMRVFPNPANTLSFKCISHYSRDLKDGIYSSCLVGLFALSIGIYLLDEGDEIYLLGYDFGSLDDKKDIKGKFLTHFYQGNIDHRGIGKINWYTSKNRANDSFGVYKNEKKIKIFNVSLNSKIDVFEKIDYDTFFNSLDDINYNQEEIRKYIKNKLGDLECLK